MAYLHEELTGEIIRAYYKVYNHLGYGFLEKVYENALFEELTELGFACEKQFPIDARDNKKPVGSYFADILVEYKVILELKASDNLCKEHEYLLINYLKATDIEVGLLFNFGKEPEFKRKIFTNK